MSASKSTATVGSRVVETVGLVGSVPSSACEAEVWWEAVDEAVDETDGSRDGTNKDIIRTLSGVAACTPVLLPWPRWAGMLGGGVLPKASAITLST